MFHLFPFLFLNCRDVDKIDDLMQDITEQQDVAREISEAISGPFGEQFDEVYVNFFSLDPHLKKKYIPVTSYAPSVFLSYFFRTSCLRSWRSWSSRSWRTTWRAWAGCPAFPAPNCLQSDPVSAQVSSKQSPVMQLYPQSFLHKLSAPGLKWTAMKAAQKT